MYNVGLPYYHSLAGSENVLFLDFDGYTSTHTEWGSISARPFDLDDNPATFSEREVAIITSIWRRVTEDYVP